MRILGAVLEEIRLGIFMPDNTHSERYLPGYEPFQIVFDCQVPALPKPEVEETWEEEPTVEDDAIQLLLAVEEDKQLEADDYNSEVTDTEKNHDKLIETQLEDVDWWQMIPDDINQPPVCLMEIGTTNIHACEEAFEHGAIPMPKCWSGQVVRTRRITRRYRPLNLPLTVNCLKCIRTQKEAE